MHRADRRWARSLWASWAIALTPFLLLTVIAAGDLALPRHRTIIGLFVLVPAVTMLEKASLRRITLVGLVSLIVCVPVAVTRWEHRPLPALTSVIGVAAITVISWLARRQALLRERLLAHIREVSEAAQGVLLRPVPRRLGPLRFEARYVAAAPQAHIGGDIYDVVWTPFGIRVMIGDVMGKGLPTLETAGVLLGAFREAAYEEPDLTALAWRLHVSLVRRGDPSLFATAQFLTFTPDTDHAELLCCGHPPPLLIDIGGHTHPVGVDSPCPPLGLLEFCPEYPHIKIDLYPGRQLLLYTDGTTEARNADNVFFPLTETVTRLAQQSPPQLADALIDELNAYTTTRLADDAALLLISKAP